MRWSAQVVLPEERGSVDLAVLRGSPQYGPLDGLLARAARHADGGALTYAGRGDGGYGALRPSSDGLLLPPRFRAAVLTSEGDRLPDGHVAPGKVVALGAQPAGGGVVLVADHAAGADGAPMPNAPVWDRLAPGVTVLLRLASQRAGPPRVVDGRVALAGVLPGGGAVLTPWGTWLSSERLAFGTAEGWRADHGWAFEIAVDGSRAPLPAAALGRLARAGLALDPAGGAIYECEAGSAGRLSRFVPARGGDLGAGRRQHLTVKERGEPLREGRSLAGTWVDEGGDADGVALAGLLDCRLVAGVLWLRGRGGRLWEYRCAGAGGLLRLVADGVAAALAELPVVTPRGGLLVVEPAPCGTTSLHGITRDGRTVPLAQSADGATLHAPTFSPDGRLLFVGVARADLPARVVAIWGPWEDGCL